MPDNSKWDVPADLIAKNYAIWISSQETDDVERDNDYKEAFEEMIGDDGYLKEWASNDMDWCDVAMYAKEVSLARGRHQSSLRNQFYFFVDRDIVHY